MGEAIAKPRLPMAFLYHISLKASHKSKKLGGGGGGGGRKRSGSVTGIFHILCLISHFFHIAYHVEPNAFSGGHRHLAIVHEK